MADETLNEPAYWVLLGTPKGPWTRDEIMHQLAAGTIVPETQACQVGRDEWFPCSRFLPEGVSGPIPTSSPSTTESAPGSSPVPPPVPGRGRRRPAPTSRLMTGVAIVGGLGLLYGAYEWLRPPTALEVCRRFEKAETIADAKTLTTPRMYRVLERLYADKTPDDPNDVFELTREIDGPDATVKHVGVRGSWYLPEEGRRAKVEGYFRVVRSDGWKIDDLVFSGVEGVSLPAPLSLVDEFQKTNSPKPSPAASRSNASSSKPSPRNGIYGWLEQRSVTEIIGLLSLGVIALGLHERFKR